MPLNNAREAIVEDRRRKVARTLLRGYSQREILEALTRGGERNPQTEAPWSLGIINRDVKALKKRWREEQAGDIAELRGAHLAEIKEAKRLAWRGERLYYIFEGLRQEAELLGLNADPLPDWSSHIGSFMAGVQTGTQQQLEDLSDHNDQP